MYVQTILSQGELTAMLLGDIDHHTAREMRKEIDALIEKIIQPFLGWTILPYSLWTVRV